ncbi:reverse transcriptase domain-containing protein [Tanacetum coccineum]
MKKCFVDEPLAIPLDEIQINDKLNFIEEPVEIMDQEVKWLKQSRIPIVKVCWNSRRGPEFTWEREDQMKKNRTAKKMEEINNFQQELDETLYQAWERFKELLMKCPQHNLTEMQEAILFYNGLDVPTRQILDSRGVVLTKTVADGKIAIPEMAEYSQKWHNGTSRGRKEGNALEEAYYTQFGGPFQGGGYRATAPGRFDNHYCEEEGNYGSKFTEAYGALHINNAIPRKEKDPRSFTLPCFINDFCFDNALVDLGASVSVMPLSTYLNLGLGEFAHTRLTVELADRTVKYPKGIAKNILVGIVKFTFLIDFIFLDMPEDVKVPLILGRPFLSIARAKIDVYKRKITLRLDLEARLMGDTLVLNRTSDHFSKDYIELNDLNEPFELRRNQGDDLIPTIEEDEVIEEFRNRDENLDTRIDDYPSYCDEDKKIHIDCAHNLKFSCMIGFEFTNANFFPLLYVNMMSRKFHNSIMKNKMVYKGNNVVGALMNVPIFIETISVMTDFAVLEDMDGYRDNEMGDIIFGKQFLREVGIKIKRFEGIITLYNGDNKVTYQMV